MSEAIPIEALKPAAEAFCRRGVEYYIGGRTSTIDPRRPRGLREDGALAVATLQRKPPGKPGAMCLTFRRFDVSLFVNPISPLRVPSWSSAFNPLLPIHRHNRRLREDCAVTAGGPRPPSTRTTPGQARGYMFRRFDISTFRHFDISTLRRFGAAAKESRVDGT